MKQFFAAVFLFAPLFANAQPADLEKQILALGDKVVEWRRHVHQFPELGNNEVKTAAFIAEHLRKLGLEVQTGVAKTGVVALLKGGKPGPVVALRADMDALPVEERNDLTFKSSEKATYNGISVPVMHACGHDAHVAVLMGTAEVLAAMRKNVPGTVKFIFQPSEEGPPPGEEGGAPLMVKEGVMNNPKVDAIFGLHISSGLEAGKLGYKKGPAMASSDWFTIVVHGRQTHGSQPWSGVDPIVTASQIIGGLQTIVSRQSELTKAPVVITIGRINGGIRENIIPEKLEMSGTIRTLDPDMRKQVLKRIETTAVNIAEAAGARADVQIDNKTLVTWNDHTLVEQTLPFLYKAVGRDNVSEEDWTTGAEDFSFFTEHAPGFYFRLGGMKPGTNPKEAPPHHTPDFMIDDSRLDAGVRAFCQLVFGYATVKK